MQNIEETDIMQEVKVIKNCKKEKKTQEKYRYQNNQVPYQSIYISLLRVVSLQDEELHRTCNESAKIQAAYGHYFDLSIVNDNLDETYRTVKAALETVSKNPQWVPVTWVF